MADLGMVVYIAKKPVINLLWRGDLRKLFYSIYIDKIYSIPSSKNGILEEVYNRFLAIHNEKNKLI